MAAEPPVINLSDIKSDAEPPVINLSDTESDKEEIVSRGKQHFIIYYFVSFSTKQIMHL
jgi:hypothetical protein